MKNNVSLHQCKLQPTTKYYYTPPIANVNRLWQKNRLAPMCTVLCRGDACVAPYGTLFHNSLPGFARFFRHGPYRAVTRVERRHVHGPKLLPNLSDGFIGMFIACRAQRITGKGCAIVKD